MSDKVVIEGKLTQWQVSDGLQHVELYFDHEAKGVCSSDFAPFSGRRVRVTVELAPEPEPEPRCPFCGGKIEETPFYHFDGDRMYAVSQTAKCLQCGARGEGPTRQAALDALAEWLDVCPRCGGKAEYKSDWYMMPWQDRKIHYWYWAVCTDKECGVRSSQCDTKRAVAAWWNKREGRK